MRELLWLPGVGHWVPWTGGDLGEGWKLPGWVGEGRGRQVGVQE